MSRVRLETARDILIDATQRALQELTYVRCISPNNQFLFFAILSIFPLNFPFFLKELCILNVYESVLVNNNQYLQVSFKKHLL